MLFGCILWALFSAPKVCHLVRIDSVALLMHLPVTRRINPEMSQMPKWSGANVPAWRTVTTSRHWIQTTITFCLIKDSGWGCSTYLSVHCRRQSISCRSRSSVEQSSIARHCCPLLSVFCCCLKSHLFSLYCPFLTLLSFVECPHSNSSFWTLWPLLHLTFIIMSVHQ